VPGLEELRDWIDAVPAPVRTPVRELPVEEHRPDPLPPSWVSGCAAAPLTPSSVTPLRTWGTCCSAATAGQELEWFAAGYGSVDPAGDREDREFAMRIVRSELVGAGLAGLAVRT
jgi:hypothetical protein